MIIKVLGSGCPKCQQLAHNAELALKQLGLAAPVQKVQDIREIAKFRVMFTPALVVNDEVKSSGRIPEVSEIVSWLSTAAGQESA